MDAKLVVVGGDAKPAEIRLRLPVIIGRGRQATLILPHPLVSRQHCEIGEYNGYLVVRDLGSLNGTFVNQRRVDHAVLPPGGVLTLGGVSFQAVYASCGSSLQDRQLSPDTASGAASTCGFPDNDQRNSADQAAHVFWDSKGTEPAAAEPAGEGSNASAATPAGGEGDNRTARMTGPLPWSR